MKRISWIAAMILCGIQLTAEDPPKPQPPLQCVVDIDGRGTRLELGTPVGNEKINVYTPDWIKGEAASRYLMGFGKNGLTPDFQEYTIGFTPQADGNVDLMLRGSFSLHGVERFVAYDDFKITGATLVNPSFEELEDGRPRGWKTPMAPVIGSDKAPDGKNYLVASQRQGAVQRIMVKKGVPVTLSFKAALAVVDGKK